MNITTLSEASFAFPPESHGQRPGLCPRSPHPDA